MESNNKDNQSVFYTVDAIPLYQSSRKPFHLEKRFKRDLNNNFNTTNKKKQVESKREAILEERRNKLNENFLKVKRIAKEIKDKRDKKINLLSQSMALAEMNRNLYIEQRRINSKKSVERAKNIAIQNQNKSIQERERRRAELENRLEKTEERRLAHLNRYKKNKKMNSIIQTSSSTLLSTEMPSTSSPKLSPNLTAPKKKPSSWSIILKAFKELNLPSPSIQHTWLEFNTLGKLLNQPKVIVITTKVLNTALKQTDEESRQRARVLLTSYMMLICPKEVLQDVNGTEEKKLHTAAKEMLQLFEFWLKAHGRPGATAARMAFVSSWNDYNLLFQNWKSRDRDQLIKNMINYYVELSTLRQTVIAQENGDHAVGQQLATQLEEIKLKLGKLGGSSLEDLQRALELASASTSTGRKKQVQNITPRSPSPPLDKKSKELKTEEMNQLLNEYVQLGLSNEQLAHELIMDPEFKLQRYIPQNQFEKRVRSMAEKAFFDKVIEDIQNDQSELSIPLLIQDIKSRLLSLVNSNTPTFQQIDEVIDLDLIRQQIQQKTFNLNKMMDFILNLASNLCAPVRDDQLKKVRESKGSDQLQHIFHLLDDMNLDLANFRLRSIRPHLMSIAVDYERQKFNGTLVKTRVWLTAAVDRLCRIETARDPERIRKPKPSYDSIVEDAIVNLICQTESQIVPETLKLDTQRLKDFQGQVQAITVVAALVMLVKNFASSDAPALSDIATTLFSLVRDDTTTIEHLSSELERHVRPERREMVRSMVDKTVRHNDTVYSLLLRRVGMVIKSTIQNSKFVSDAVLTSNGLDHVRSPLQSLALHIQRLAHHNKKVYVTWYDQIIKQALQNHPENQD